MDEHKKGEKMYKPIEYMPQTSTRARIQLPEPEPDNPMVWTTIALWLCGVVTILASVAMMYLVWVIALG